MITNGSAEVGVNVWHHSQYIQQTEPGPPMFMPLQYIKNHVARYDITISDMEAWATISVGKVCLA